MKKTYDRTNVGVSMKTIGHYASERRDHERAAADVLPGEAMGVDLTTNRKERSGVKTLIL